MYIIHVYIIYIIYLTLIIDIFFIYLPLIQPLRPKAPLRVFELTIEYCTFDLICPLNITEDNPL